MWAQCPLWIIPSDAAARSGREGNSATMTKGAGTEAAYME
jgi:hypothetical protein